MAHLTDLDHTAPADSLKSGAQVLNTWRTRIDALNDVLGSITAAEATQIEAMGTTTISAAQWVYAGAANQSLVTTASPTFNGLTLTSLTLNAAFTLGGTLTLGGTVAGGDYAWSNVGDMTFAAGSILKSGSSNGNTLILAANDTTCITLTTGSTDKVEIVALNVLTAIANLDIGSYTFTCAGLIDDSLTSGRVVFASTGGLLADDSDFLFNTDTLTVTKIGAFQAVGAIDFNSQNMTSVDIDSGTIGGVTLDGAITGGDQSWTGVGNMTFTNGSILASGSSASDTLILKANDTTCITLTTGATDKVEIVALNVLTAINNLDIGAYTFRCNGLIDDSLTSGRVIFATTNGQLADDGDMTFSTDTLTVKKAVLNDATTATTDMFTLTPGGAVAAGATWKGIYINGAALDPAGANAEIEGIYVDLSGVATANSPEMRGVYASVPAGLGYEALHIVGKIKLDNDESTLAPGETATGVDIIVSASGASGGEYHAIDVATTGTSSASLTALATHTGIDVIHQHTGSFISPTKAWNYDDSGTSYADTTTAFGSAGTDVTIFPDDDDAIFIGADTAFDEIEVILATSASVDIKPTFWYSTAVTFIRFFPADDTEGFTQDGTIRFDADDLANFAALSVSGTSKYYIKIIRTKNNVVTDPIEDTIKTLVATECFWNNVGAVQVVSIAVPTITTVTTFTASGNLDIGAYSFRAATLLADGLTSGRVVFTTSNGQLTDDLDFTFSTDTLTVTKIGAFEATGAINFASQNMTNVDIDSGTIDGISALTSSGDLDIGAHDLRAATITADGLTTGRVVFTTANGQLVDNANFTLSTNTLALGASGTLDVSSGTLTLDNDQISGDKVQGGTIGSTTISALTTAGITATSNIDIGAYDFRAQTVTPDNLTSGRVVFATTNGQLTDDQDMTFSVATLTVTNIAAFNLTGKLTAGATEIEGSAFDINGGDMTGVTISGALTWSAAQDLNNQALTNVDINSGAIDGVTIGGSAAPTVTNLGTVTTCDINGGTIGGITFDGALTMSLGSDVDGDIYYRTSNVLTRLAKGTGLHVLRMNAGATAPEWAAGGSGTVDTSGTPVDNDFAKFTDADTIEGRSYSETVSDLSLDTRRLFNLCRNATLVSRSGGTSAVPDEYVLEGTPTVAYDTVDVGYGDYAIKLTATGAGDEGIKQTYTHLKATTKYQVFARVKVDAGDTASIITTGATSNINEDSSSESWEDITGEFITDASGTDVVVRWVASADTDVAYFCGLTCVEGDVPPGNFIRRVNETIYLTTAITDTSWDGDGYSSTEADLDLSAFGNGCPPKIKAVMLFVRVNDSGSAGGFAYIRLGTGGVALGWTNTHFYADASYLANDTNRGGAGMVFCDANGDIRYQVVATGTNTCDVIINILGYVLGE